MAASNQYDGVWVIDSVDPNYRFETQGDVVKSGEPICIRHVQSCVYLASCKNSKYKNDFGSENEVHCHNHATTNRSQNLALEYEGRLTSDVPTKFLGSQNLFIVHHAPDASYSRSVEDLQKYDINDLIKDVKNKILDRSSFGIRGIKRIFKAMDDKGDHNLDVDDFRWGLIDYGISVSKEEAAEILAHFDRDKNGTVNFDEFIRTLKVSKNNN